MQVLRLATESFDIWRSVVIDIPIWATAKSGPVVNKIVSYESLVSATLNVTITAEFWPSWGNIAINGVKVQDIDFRFGSGQINLEIDVTGRILNGSNNFTIILEKTPWVGLGGKWFVDAVLIVDGTGVKVKTDWWADLVGWLGRNKYAVLGAGMAGVGVVYYGSKEGWFK